MVEVFGTYRPYLTDIDVARYCESHGYASLEDLKTEHGLLQAAATRRLELKFRLRELLGDARLFTSLVVAGLPEPEPEYDEDEIEIPLPVDPLTEDAFDGYVASVPSDLSNAEANEWLTGSRRF
ncbi:hypothetical protein [Brevibacterium zhoupengii]|uniref:hypothetical protein n=1 Tax=Brevibacterium zhoupengii TaxID=2898795 RepID=UPI001F08F416|nr:hypothetical protein [Brevibacterium zhoupengii]